MGLRVHGIICGFWFGIWASRTLKLIVLTSTPEESGGLMSLLIPVICHSRKASATGEHPRPAPTLGLLGGAPTGYRLGLWLGLWDCQVPGLGGSWVIGCAGLWLHAAGRRAGWAIWLGQG